MNRLQISALQATVVLTIFTFSFFVAFASDSDLIAETSEQEETQVLENGKIPYRSIENSISFSYPEEWDIQDRVINSVPYIRLEKIDVKQGVLSSVQEGHLKIEILSFPDKNLSLDVWVRQQNKRSQPGQNILERKEIEVDGEKAIYQLEEYTDYNHISQAVFVAKDDKVYIINFSNNREENKAVVDEFLASFHFNSEL